MRYTLEDALLGVAYWFSELASHGPDLRVNAHLKTLHEAEEFAAEPSLEELADVMICLMGAAQHRGWTLDEMSQAVAAKLSVNQERTWYQKLDGTWQHN
jgi:predicted house-cleaning noncanonical NTP pyrophosphatase (MazG superfamily)